MSSSQAREVKSFFRDNAIEMLVDLWHKWQFPEVEIKEWHQDLLKASDARIEQAVWRVVYKSNPNIEVLLVNWDDVKAVELGPKSKLPDDNPWDVRESPRATVEQRCFLDRRSEDKVLCPVSRPI